MNAMVFQCPGCQRAVNIDYKTRKGVCEWCGNVCNFPRSAFNQSDHAESELKICMRCFAEKRYEDARFHAESVLSVAVDNLPALYARAFYDAFHAVNKKSDRIPEFFRQLFSVGPDPEENVSLKEMFLSTAPKLAYWEEDVLRWAEDALPARELCAFADAFSPALILRRTSIDYFTPELADTYVRIAAKCSIPKTCYALLQSVKVNPDSPYPENKFFLRTKTQRFYEQYVVPLGEIIQSMDSQELRDKFFAVYQKQKEDLKNKMSGGMH